VLFPSLICTFPPQRKVERQVKVNKKNLAIFLSISQQGVSADIIQNSQNSVVVNLPPPPKKKAGTKTKAARLLPSSLTVYILPSSSIYKFK
jgi:hypothetical protein